MSFYFPPDVDTDSKLINVTGWRKYISIGLITVGFATMLSSFCGFERLQTLEQQRISKFEKQKGTSLTPKETQKARYDWGTEDALTLTGVGVAAFGGYGMFAAGLILGGSKRQESESELESSAK